MVIASVVIDKKDSSKLTRLGVKDSKVLSPKRREELSKQIENIARNIVVMRVQPCKIDTYRERGINLDKIEAMKMAEIIDICGGGKFFIDSLEQNSKKFKQLIVSFLKDNDKELVVENYMDESVPVVSAASIIAKVNRDAAIDEIKRREGFDFGVGYPHDAKSVEFVKKLIKERGGKLPPYIRKSWITTQTLLERSWQQKVKDFFKKQEKCKEGRS